SGTGLPKASPFTPHQLAALVGLRTRDVLTHCLRHQERCARAKQWLEPEGGPSPKPAAARSAPAATPAPAAPENPWNDFQTSCTTVVPDDEASLARLVKWAVVHLSDEMATGHHFGADVDGRFIDIEIHGPGNVVDKRIAAVCNKAAKGGGLGKQI